MSIPQTLVENSEHRLDFDPAALSKELKHRRPIDNEPPERRRIRLAVAETQGIDALERVIAENDLISINYLERGLLVSQAIGRIHKRQPGTGKLLEYATGFMISPYLLLTNNHVLASAEDAIASQVEFNYQRDHQGTLLNSEFYELLPDQFFFTHKGLDFAIVAVEQTARSSGQPLNTFGWIRLDRRIGKVSPGESLTIIQHPQGQDKQIALRENQLLKIQADSLWYRTDTAPGSSGSPVFNDSWQVVALHRSGVPAKDDHGNYIAIDGQVLQSSGAIDETRIQWIANEGTRASRIIETIEAEYSNHPLIHGIFSENAPQPAHKPYAHKPTHNSQDDSMATISNLPISDSALSTIYIRNGESAHSSDSKTLDQTSVNVEAKDGATRITMPLTTTVQLDNTTGSGATSIPVATDAEDYAKSIDPDYTHRQGYDPEFVGTGSRRIVLPELSDAARELCAINQQARPGEDPVVLPYHHFSVVMNKERKLAFFTAVNIDGAVSHRIQRQSDRWILDPRIARDEQADNSVYVNNDLDRGHLVRRLDPAWGDTFEIAKAANDDTFHYTNCSPQHARFNQNNATWLGLENYILDNAIAENLRITVFTGPVLEKDDEFYRGIQLPRQYWKVLAIVKDGELSATGYLLSQANLIQNFSDKEAFANDQAVAHFQVPIRRIETLTGLSFGKLNFYDPLEGLESTRSIQSIGSYEAIRF